jgi:hypothetical protein
MAVLHNLNANLAVFERYFENLVGEVPIDIEFVKRLEKEFSLKREVHAHRTIETNKSGMERYFRILTFGPGSLSWPAEIFAILGHQYPVLVQQDSLELPVLPTRLADPYHMSILVVASLPRHESEF